MNVEDRNDLSTQRRNLMVMNVLVFLLAITEIEIKSFKIFNIDFLINDSVKYINSFNDLLLIAWVYFIVRYSSTLFYIIYDNKRMEKDVVLEETTNYLSNNSFILKVLNNTFIKLGEMIFKKENLNELPIFLSLLIILKFYLNTYIIIGICLYLVFSFLYLYNLVLLKLKLKEEKKLKELEFKKIKNYKNNRILYIREIYNEKKKLIRNKRKY